MCFERFLLSKPVNVQTNGALTKVETPLKNVINTSMRQSKNSIILKDIALDAFEICEAELKMMVRMGTSLFP